VHPFPVAGRVTRLALMLATSSAALTALTASASAQTVNLPTVDVISPTPVPGAVGIEANKVPGILSSVTAQDFDRRKMPSVVDAITQKVPGAIGINVDGSDLSPDLFIRGFNVSRLSGVANGLAVYQNGVRINETFGDGVNLDLVPPIAVDHADVYTNNPIFGLNALGGAVAFTMKNGFTFQGANATIMGGSYGRVNGNFEYGKQIGNYSLYVAADGYRDGGYRPFGAQNAQRAYVDVGYRTQDAEIHGIAGFGRSLLGVQGVTPKVLVNERYNSVFTTPQTTENRAETAQITGRFEIAPRWTLSSNFYVRKYDQVHVDGNDANVEASGGFLVLDDDDFPNASAAQRAVFINGQRVPGVARFPYGTTVRSFTNSTTFGTQQQLTNRDQIMGHENYFVFGGSVDKGSTNYSAYTTLGQLNSSLQNVEAGIPGAGGILIPGDPNIGFGPTKVRANSTYYGVFALDTFNITKELALTAGARFNLADVELVDLTGLNPSINSRGTYSRINPMVGLTYEFNKAFTVYAGYSEANRVPTPLETACSDPLRPCILESSLISDPPLKQVISRTVEAGARGTYLIPNEWGALTYKAGYFRVENTNDIVSQASVVSGHGFFTNVPGTLRQGAEAGLVYNRGPLSFYGNYAFVDATYNFTGSVSSPQNPFANDNGEVIVRPGNHIPGIPRHLGKLGFDYWFTPKFKVGMDALLVGEQYYVGDDTNRNPKLPFYYRLDLHASYQVTDNIQVFGLINNITDNRYATYGTFYETGTSARRINNTLLNNSTAANPNPQAVTVAQPISVYGGVKVSF